MDRLKLEQNILGCVILHNDFARIANILSPRNFTDTEQYQNQTIWIAIRSLYPDNPIDLLTVNRTLREKYNLDYAYYLSHCTDSVCDNSHLTFWALMLVEIDIRKKLIRKIFDFYTQASEQKNLTKKGHLSEILDYCNDKSNDLFDAVESIYSYLDSMNYRDEMEEIKKFKENVASKVHEIKSISQIDTIFRNLSKLETVSGSSYVFLDRLIQIFKTACAKENIPQEAIELIIHLQNKLNS